MCATFWLGNDDIEEIKNIADEITRKYGSEKAEQCFNRDYYPKAEVPVVGPENKVSLLRWGFPVSGSKGVIFNARSESLAERPMFKSVINNRCLVPATAFYEWDKNKNKYRISIENIKLFYIAAIWKGYMDLSGNKSYYFALITTQPNDQIGQIHNRMPVIITPDKAEYWISNDEDALKLLAPYEKMMTITQIGK